MHGDFSRVTFRPEKHFSGVVAQQGRMQLDAEANEQAAIQAHQARTLTTDLVGPHAGPFPDTGFAVAYQADADPPDLTIGAGRYYVGGIPVDATKPAPPRPVPASGSATGGPGGGSAAGPGPSAATGWTYWTQPDAFGDKHTDDDLPAVPFLVYLTVSERLVTAVEDPDIRESALGAALPDTAARLKVGWQVRPIRPDDGFTQPSELTAPALRKAFDDWAAALTAPASWLAVRTEQPAHTDDDPCFVHPDARFRGLENQLYRIEIHQGGAAGTATFKWSRDNGAVVFGVTAVEGAWVTLDAAGRDDKLDLHVGDWTELVDDATTARGTVSALLRVEEVDVPARRVRLSAEPPATVGRRPERHPFLRRWDQSSAGVAVTEGTWIDLEDGVQVWFAASGNYRTGEYWTAPARVLTGEVEWPRAGDGTPLLAPPAGPTRHYAPLAWIGDGQSSVDLREAFGTLAVPIEQLHPPTKSGEESK